MGGGEIEGGVDDRNLERLQRLAQSNNASANDMDEAQSTLDMTDQSIRRAEVAIDQTRRRIEQTRVVAPFAGVVVERLVQVGEFVARGAQVARLVDTQNREIRAKAPLSIAPYLREGLEVSIEHRNKETLSPVARIIPVGDERSRMFEVRIAAQDPSWVVGSPVRVALPNGDPRELLAIPRDALVLRGTEVFVHRPADVVTALEDTARDLRLGRICGRVRGEHAHPARGAAGDVTDECDGGNRIA